MRRPHRAVVAATVGSWPSRHAWPQRKEAFRFLGGAQKQQGAPGPRTLASFFADSVTPHPKKASTTPGAARGGSGTGLWRESATALFCGHRRGNGERCRCCQAFCPAARPKVVFTAARSTAPYVAGGEALCRQDMRFA